MLRGQIATYPDGQFVVEFEGEIVGYAASFRIDEKSAMGPHTWDQITGGGYGARHDPHGDWLYGMEVCVDPARRRLRIGQRLYDARRDLCEAQNLKGIVFGGRMPGLSRRKGAYPDPRAYLDAVMARRVNDPVIGFHLRSGFEPVGVLKNYLKDDTASMGHAAHMVARLDERDGLALAGGSHRRRHTSGGGAIDHHVVIALGRCGKNRERRDENH